MFITLTLTQGMMVHFMFGSLTLCLGYCQLMMRMLITLSRWVQSLLLIGMGIMPMIFAIHPVVSSSFVVPLKLQVTDSIVMTDASYIVDVLVGTPLGTSDHCFSVVCFGLSNLYRSTMSEVLFF